LSRRQLALGSNMCSASRPQTVPTRSLTAGPRQPLVPQGGTRAGSGRVARRWPADRGLLALPSGVGRRRGPGAHLQERPKAGIAIALFFLITVCVQRISHVILGGDFIEVLL
jgi:hypothetical protein